MTSLTSGELNFLVFRYLQESGFTHAAFSLGYEANIDKTPIDGSLVPPGALITVVQKGLQYLEMEANLSNVDTEEDGDFSFLQPLDLITKDVKDLRHIIRERKKREGAKAKEKEVDKEHERARRLVKDRDKQGRKREREKVAEKIEDKPREKEHKKMEKLEEKPREKEHNKIEKLDKEHNKIEREKEHNKTEKLEKEHSKIEREKEHNKTEKLEKEYSKIEREKEHNKIEKLEKDHNKIEKLEEVAREKEQIKMPEPNSEVQKNVMQGEVRASGGAELIEISTTTANKSVEFSSSDVTILEGHTSEVCACAWSPSGSYLASGSGDSTARIWKVSEETQQPSAQNGSSSVNDKILLHLKGKTAEKSKDVTSVDWNLDGTLLATGAYDGVARIWTVDGTLKATLTKHVGPIFSLKWNRNNDYILTGSCDRTAIVWDVKTEQIVHQYEFHTGPALDVDWQNNDSFATCSTDQLIQVCKIGVTQPIKTFSDHQGEVNCVKWDPMGLLLASCSDDATAKIWSMENDKCVHDFRGHEKEIYNIRWSPTGPGTNNPNLPLLLASASFDSTVKLWDVDQGRLQRTLIGHSEAVYSIAFSPNGEYLASGSLDRSLLIWSVKEGKVIKRYKGQGGIFEVGWNPQGDKISAGFANNIVCIMDFRM